jgi:hypothetical protein
VSSYKDQGPPSLPQLRNRPLDLIGPSWLYVDNLGPLPPYVWQPLPDATAAGQQGTSYVEDHLDVGHYQSHDSQNSHSLQLLHQTSSFAEGMCQFKSTLRPSNTVRPTASTDARSVTKSSGSSIFSSMSTLLLLHGVLHTNLASSAGTSGHTSLPTSAFITDAENALDRGGTSNGITPPNTPQGLRSNVPSTVRSSGASMQRKGA